MNAFRTTHTVHTQRRGHIHACKHTHKYVHTLSHSTSKKTKRGEAAFPGKTMKDNMDGVKETFLQSRSLPPKRHWQQPPRESSDSITPNHHHIVHRCINNSAFHCGSIIFCTGHCVKHAGAAQLAPILKHISFRPILTVWLLLCTVWYHCLMLFFPLLGLLAAVGELSVNFM